MEWKRFFHRHREQDEKGETGIEADWMLRVSEERIRRLKVHAGRGLWAMALFLAVSIIALDDFRILPDLPPVVRDTLGNPPSVLAISGLLVLYTFSALVLILARMMSGSGTSSGFYHVGYLSAFYGFYHFAGALEDNYWAVFVSGMTILTLESYHIWSWCSERIREELETIEEEKRKGGGFR